MSFVRLSVWLRGHMPVVIFAASAFYIAIRLAVDISFIQSNKQLLSRAAAPLPETTHPGAFHRIALETLDWMGQPPVVAAPPPMEVVQPLLVEINLKGAFTDSEGQLASALIAVGGGEARRYFVGEPVHEAWILQKVTEEWVELLQNGAVNRIYFPFAQERTPAVPRSRRARLQEFQVQVMQGH